MEGEVAGCSVFGELSRVPKLTLTEAHEERKEGRKSAVNLFLFSSNLIFILLTALDFGERARCRSSAGVTVPDHHRGDQKFPTFVEGWKFEMCIFENLFGEIGTQILTLSYLYFIQFLPEVAWFPSSYFDFQIWIIYGFGYSPSARFKLKDVLFHGFGSELLCWNKKVALFFTFLIFSFNFGLAGFLSWPLLEISERFFLSLTRIWKSFWKWNDPRFFALSHLKWSDHPERLHVSVRGGKNVMIVIFLICSHPGYFQESLF